MKLDLLLMDTGSKWCNYALLYTYKAAKTKGVNKLDSKVVFDILAEYKQNHVNLNTLLSFRKGLYYGLKKICTRNQKIQDFKRIEPVFSEFKYKRPGRVYHSEDYLTVKELADLIKISSAKEACFLKILSYSGMRIGECLNIKLTDMRTVKNNTLIALRKTKTKKHRVIMLPEKLIQQIRSTFNSKTYLFENEIGNPYNPRAVQKIFQRMSKRIGKRITPHLLRHWFINQRAENANLYDLNALASYVGNTLNILVGHYLDGKFKESNSYQPVKRKLDKELQKKKKK